MKYTLFAFAAPIIGTAGQLLLKRAMRDIGPIDTADLSQVLRLLGTLLGNPPLIAAASLYFVGFFLWLVVLSKLDLSYAYPILALSYLLVPVFSWLAFGEQIPMLRWIGVGVICVGVVLVSLSQ